MLRSLLLIAILLALAGCAEEKKVDTPTAPADTSTFDKKQMPPAPLMKPPPAQKGS